VIVNDGNGAASVKGGVVTLEVKSVVANVADQLGLPDVSSKLSPSVANLKILDSKQVKVVQDGGKALKALALLLTIIVPLLYALAIFLAGGRWRRTLMTVGFAIVAAGPVVFAARKIVESGVTNPLVKSEDNRRAANAVGHLGPDRGDPPARRHHRFHRARDVRDRGSATTDRAGVSELVLTRWAKRSPAGSPTKAAQFGSRAGELVGVAGAAGQSEPHHVGHRYLELIDPPQIGSTDPGAADAVKLVGIMRTARAPRSPRCATECHHLHRGCSRPTDHELPD
jgi:hypothetical protein